MAKKSAKSKGYRKQVAKKPYLSKRDITVLCVLIVALVIGAFFLFRYDDGALKVKGGSVVTEGDNWLIVNGSVTRGRPRYFKLGEMGQIDGYTREDKSISTDANIPEYAFTPESPNGVSGITVTTSHSDPATLAKYAVSMLSEMDGTDVADIQTVELGGREVTYFTYTTEYHAADEADANAEAAPAEAEPAETETESAEAEAAPADSEAEADPAEAEAAPADSEAEAAPAEAEAAPAEAEPAETKAADSETEAEPAEAETTPNRFSKVLSGYFTATHDSCIAVHVETEAPSSDDYCSDEDLVMLLEKAVSAVTLEEQQ